MCKGFKKFLKVIGVIAAIAGAAAGIYIAVKKITARKESADYADEFVPCECCDCEECGTEPCDESTPAETPAENGGEESE
ncbi:MAG: hypothetical protein GX107_06870 [Clostridiales bacterium]|jgi:hypothetical protein|nr:hypothetical protein [Clostridiales bacterium]